MQLKYIPADTNDAEEIARLHALSWQRHYRNIYPEDYLRDQVVAERRKVWFERFAQSDANRLIIKVVDRKVIIGFVCTFLNMDPQFGALIDNLHVLQEYQGQGIGRHLLHLSAEWVMNSSRQQDIYLYVLAENYPAAAFYKKLGAKMSAPFLLRSPAGSNDNVIRCSWKATELFDNSRN